MIKLNKVIFKPPVFILGQAIQQINIQLIRHQRELFSIKILYLDYFFPTF